MPPHPAEWTKGQFLWVRPGRETTGYVFAVRRRLGCAVRRNRLKRRLRHICRAVVPRAYSIVLFPQPGSTEISYAKLHQELVELFSRLD